MIIVQHLPSLCKAIFLSVFDKSGEHRRGFILFYFNDTDVLLSHARCVLWLSSVLKLIV